VDPSTDVHGALRRALNEDRRSRFGEPGRLISFVCECGDPTCRRTVVLTPEEYDAQGPGRLLHAEHA
jgi:hypothetical protein